MNDVMNRLHRATRCICYAAIFLLLFTLSSYIQSQSDDLVFQEGISRYGGITEWAAFYSQNWGGRVIPHGLLVLMLQMPNYVFSLLNTIAWMALLYYVKRDYDVQNQIAEILLYCSVFAAIFILIPAEILSESIFWKCANVLYLWGGAGILAAIYPILYKLNHEDVPLRYVIIAAIAIGYTAGFEQAAAVMCGMLAPLSFVLFWRERRVDWVVAVLCVEAIGLTGFFCMYLPGNSVRSVAETLRHLPKYDMYSNLDKAIWGVNYAIRGLESKAPFLIWIISVTVVAILIHTRSSRMLCTAAVIVCAYFTLNVVDYIGTQFTDNQTMLSSVFQLVEVDSMDFVRTGTTKSMVHVLMYVLLGALSAVTIPEQIDILSFLTYYGGLASMWLMGFSPTIYASGSRTLFLGCLFMILVEIRLISLWLAYIHTGETMSGDAVPRSFDGNCMAGMGTITADE